jgi:putative FmdB family regulatory protein
MPTYDYQCDGCGHRFERFQRIHDKPLRTCPACGKERVRRLISAGGGLIFKGSGFYVTDSRSGGGSSAQKAQTDKKAEGSKGKATTRRTVKED